MKLTDPSFRIGVGVYTILLASYLALFTVKDYGLWIGLGGTLVTAGIAKSFAKKQ